MDADLAAGIPQLWVLRVVEECDETWDGACVAMEKARTAKSQVEDLFDNIEDHKEHMRAAVAALQCVLEGGPAPVQTAIVAEDEAPCEGIDLAR